MCPVLYLENMNNNANFYFKMGTYEIGSAGRALKITIYMLKA